MQGVLCATVLAAVTVLSQGASLRHGRHGHNDPAAGPLRGKGPPGPYSAPGKSFPIPAILKDVPADTMDGSGKGGGSDKCADSPKCEYHCQQPGCHAPQECDPFCEAPKCDITCGTNPDKCETRCGEPMCVVVCPKSTCEGYNCSSTPIKCQTVCSKPLCTTSCHDNCRTSCAKPICRWNCKANSKCGHPQCEMKCKSISGCSVALSASASASLANETDAALQAGEGKRTKDGRVIVAMGRAKFDAGVLDQASLPASPAPAPATAAAAPGAAAAALRAAKAKLHEKLQDRIRKQQASTPSSQGKVETKSWAWGALSAPKEK